MATDLKNSKFYLVLQGRVPSSFRINASLCDGVLSGIYATQSLELGFKKLFPRCLAQTPKFSFLLPGGSMELCCEGLLFALEQSRIFSVGDKKDFVLALELRPIEKDTDFKAFDDQLNAVLSDKEARPDLVAAMLPENAAEVVEALRVAESLSFATRSYDFATGETMSNEACLALVAYYIYGGMMLGRHENQIFDFALGRENNDTQNQTGLVLGLSIFLSDLDRLFLSRSTSLNSGVRSFISQIIQDGRYRERWLDQQAAVERLQSIQSLRDRDAALKIQKSMQIILAAVSILGLPAAIFFGMFTVTRNADVVRSGGAVLMDQQIIFLFFIIVAACLGILSVLGTLAFMATRQKTKQ